MRGWLSGNSPKKKEKKRMHPTLLDFSSLYKKIDMAATRVFLDGLFTQCFDCACCMQSKMSLRVKVAIALQSHASAFRTDIKSLET